jgi:hypothetical protein
VFHLDPFLVLFGQYLVHVCPALALFISYNGGNVIIIIVVVATTIVSMTIITGSSQHGVSSYGGVVGQHEPHQHHDTGGVRQSRGSSVTTV